MSKSHSFYVNTNNYWVASPFLANAHLGKRSWALARDFTPNCHELQGDQMHYFTISWILVKWVPEAQMTFYMVMVWSIVLQWLASQLTRIILYIDLYVAIISLFLFWQMSQNADDAVKARYTRRAQTQTLFCVMGLPFARTWLQTL